MFDKIAVLMGGTSAEREISLQSGQAVLDALQESGLLAQKVDPADKDFVKILVNGNFSHAFIALHGTFGEDGTVQGLLESLKIPYTGSGVLGSALAFNKIKSKRIWQAMGLSNLPFVVWQPNLDLGHFTRQFGFPLVVKPACQGSSVGVFKVENLTELNLAVEKDHQYGEIIIEPWIDGTEYTVGILNSKALPAIKIIHSNEFYDYEAKYLSDATQYICPSKLDKENEIYLQETSLAAFSALGVSGWGRVDFIRDKKGTFWLFEINTVPGLSVLIPKAAAAVGISFKELILEILKTASFKTSFLTNYADITVKN